MLKRAMSDPHDFYFEDMAVGIFAEIPRVSGRFRYEPYRGPGHYEMQTLLRSGGYPRCYYDSGDVRVIFTVRNCPEYGVLELGDFVTVPQAAVEADTCPRCGTPVAGESVGGIWSGRFVTADGRVFGNGPGYSAICKYCLADLEACTIYEEAERRKFYWNIRELGPPSHLRPSYQQEKSSRESILSPLLEVHADHAQVLNGLGLNFADFSVGGNQRAELKQWLFFDEVNHAAARYPGIFFHMSDFTMTWLFFDAENRLQGYFIRPV